MTNVPFKKREIIIAALTVSVILAGVLAFVRYNIIGMKYRADRIPITEIQLLKKAANMADWQW